MYNSQLLKILKTLSKSEVKELAKFVQAPCFNSREDVTNLFNYLAQNHGSTPSVFQKEKIFAVLFPKKKYDDGLMRLLIHNLLKVVKIYFTHHEMSENAAQEQVLLAKAMRKRGFHEYFEKEITTAETFVADLGLRHAGFHFQNYQISDEITEQASLLKRQDYTRFHQLNMHLVSFFAAETLRQACAAHAFQMVSKLNYKVPMLDAVLDYVESNLLTEQSDTEGVAVLVYYHTYKALVSPNSLYFNSLKGLITQHYNSFPASEIRYLYLAALNICIKKINQGEDQFRQEAFELYASGIENKALFENGLLSKFTFKNAVSAGIMMKQNDWVENFIKTSRVHLPVKDREAAYNFNLAVFYFRTGNHDAAMNLLQSGDFGDVLTTLSAKIMLLRIYYETESLEALMSLLDSMQVFINRQTQINYQKEVYLNLIKIVRKMMKTNLRDTDARQNLREEIQQTQYLAERDWLLSQLK